MSSKAQTNQSSKNDTWTFTAIERTVALASPVTQLRFVNEARATLFSRLKISTTDELLMSLPFRFLDFTTVDSIINTQIGQPATVVCTVDEVKKKHVRRGLELVEVWAFDNTAVIAITFFNQPWIADQIQKGMLIAFSGKIGFSYGYKRMSSPFFEILEGSTSQGANQKSTRTKILPVHHATEGLSTAWIRRIISSAIDDFNMILDPLPANIRAKRSLMAKSKVIRYGHFPNTFEEAEEARRRVAYQEVLELQIALMARRDASLFGLHPTSHITNGEKLQRLKKVMPFELTCDQARTVQEIAQDMSSSKAMNRLVLGDVGTGKTAVGVYALIFAADTGTQAALMAPTSVLAHQYATKLGDILDACDVSWALITGSTPDKEKKEIYRGLSDGSISIVFGTHALIQEEVVFKNLTLVVIDEQHRFGVEQRAALRKKGDGADLLIMTATPIPRTLALSIYGDLDTSILRERPVEGAGVDTKVLSKSNRGVAYDEIKKALLRGEQAYVVCPLIGTVATDDEDTSAVELSFGNDPSDMKAAEQEREILQRTVFPEYNVGLLTGRMKSKEKEYVMDAFRSGDIDVLVSTTVIEVGVDVPNATVMMIEDAERFGLAQLHQLRGRVGRGDKRGSVFLITDSRSKTAKERVQILEHTSDGFKVAQADLKIRSEGEVVGQRQHGAVSLTYVDLENDADLIEYAHVDSQKLLEADPKLERDNNLALKLSVYDTYGDVFTEVSGG